MKLTKLINAGLTIRDALVLQRISNVAETTKGILDKNICPAHLTQIADKLIAKGLITRGDHPTDRRRYTYKPTDEGLALTQ